MRPKFFLRATVYHSLCTAILSLLSLLLVLMIDYLFGHGKCHFPHFNDTHAIDIGFSGCFGDSKFGIPFVDLHFHDERVSGYDGSLPFDAIDATKKEDGPGYGSFHLQTNDSGELSQGFYLQDARHDWSIGEVALEELFILVDYGKIASTEAIILDKVRYYLGKLILMEVHCENIQDNFQSATYLGDTLDADGSFAWFIFHHLIDQRKGISMR